MEDVPTTGEIVAKRPKLAHPLSLIPLFDSKTRAYLKGRTVSLVTWFLLPNGRAHDSSHIDVTIVEVEEEDITISTHDDNRVRMRFTPSNLWCFHDKPLESVNRHDLRMRRSVAPSEPKPAITDLLQLLRQEVLFQRELLSLKRDEQPQDEVNSHRVVMYLNELYVAIKLVSDASHENKSTYEQVLKHVGLKLAPYSDLTVRSEIRSL